MPSGEAEEFRRSKERREIIRALGDGGPMTPKQVAEALGKPEKYPSVKVLMGKLRAEGKRKRGAAHVGPRGRGTRAQPC